MTVLGRGLPSKWQLVMALTAIITTIMMVAFLSQDRPRDVLTVDSVTNFLNNLRMMDPTDHRTPTTKLRQHCSVVPEVPSWDEYYNYVEEQRNCARVIVLGGKSNNTKDGGAKTVCLDPGFAPPANNCTVLSFGINNEFSFDDAIANKMGCDVYAFDPTMNTPDHLRGERVRFYDLGIGADSGLGPAKPRWHDEAETVKVDTYMGILKRLNLLNTTIDYLKMDIEQAELYFFRDTIDNHPDLLKNVRQIGMEIHFGRLNTRLRDEFWWYLHQLRCLKFRPVYTDKVKGKNNRYRLGERRVSAAYEIVWVNDAFMELAID